MRIADCGIFLLPFGRRGKQKNLHFGNELAHYFRRGERAIMADGKMESSGPLKGVRIIDLSMMLAGPSGSMLMGDLGAEIIKVEPLDGDETRVGPPYFYEENMSAYYWSINRNKKSVVINL
jgi:hypothetical protein